MNGLQGLFDSRKFMLAALDALVSIVVFFVGKYAGVAIEDVKFLIAALQPIAVMVIIYYGKEDVAFQAANPIPPASPAAVVTDRGT